VQKQDLVKLYKRLHRQHSNAAVALDDAYAEMKNLEDGEYDLNEIQSDLETVNAHIRVMIDLVANFRAVHDKPVV